MNGNILIPPDTTTASLEEEPNCNTYYKTNSFLSSNFKYS